MKENKEKGESMNETGTQPYSNIDESDDLQLLNHATPRNIARVYLRSTTTHGLGRIYSSKSIYMRLFWTVIFLVVFGLLTRAVVTLIIKATKNDITTKVQSKFHRSMPFPAVTICNNNPFRKSRIIKFNLKPPNTTSGYFRKAAEAELKLSLRLGKLNASELYKVGHPMGTFLMRNMGFCFFGNDACNFTKDFVRSSNPLAGNCYTFNSRNRVQKQADTGAGLSIALNINQDEYSLGFSWRFSSAGARVAIHHPDEPASDTKALLLAPGTFTDIKIAKKIQIRQPDPYPDNCVKMKTMEKMFGIPIRYTTELCQLHCYLENQNKHCGYVTPLLEATLNGIFRDLSIKTKFKFKVATNVSQVACLHEFDDLYYKGRFKCRCFPPCHEEQFQLTATHSTWPTKNEAPKVLADLKLAYARSKYFKNWTVEDLYRNVMAMDIYFKDFSVETIEQKPAYSWDDFASDLGGQLGLWIGASVFSACEFGCFIANLIAYCAFWRNKRKFSIENRFEKELTEMTPEAPAKKKPSTQQS
eukprot:Seg6164.1 transcript_id=Seg6164.1/GoldUCD/mRNA.D3Y31 product="Acid-sensing ion channel 1" protein_id=Seg6164.1/GoldUCD/D3Y31